MEQKIKQQTKGTNEDKKLLKEYLNQYYISRIKRVQLEKRLKNILEEMNAPIGGYGYSPVNYGGTNKVSDGAASFVYRISTIETRIEEQKKRVETALLNVMDIIDLLDEDSTERIILELRFIDCKSWTSIAREMHLSRRTCFRYQDSALEELLDFGEVMAFLDKGS